MELNTFYKGTNLESVTVKAPEVEYAGDSVYNEDPKVTLHCYIDSTSVAYAKKYGIKSKWDLFPYIRIPCWFTGKNN